MKARRVAQKKGITSCERNNTKGTGNRANAPRATGFDDQGKNETKKELIKKEVEIKTLCNVVDELRLIKCHEIL